MPVVVIKLQEKKIIREFLMKGALNKETAKPLNELYVSNSHAFSRLISKGLVIRTEDDRYYADMDSVEEQGKSNRMKSLIVIAIIVIILFAYFTSGHIF